MSMKRFITSHLIIFSIIVTMDAAPAQSPSKAAPAPKTGSASSLLSILGGGSIFGPVKHDSVRDELIRNCDAAVAQGNTLLKAGVLDAAIASFQSALRYDGASGPAYIGLADAYTAQGQIGKAIDAYRALFYPWQGRNWGNSSQSSSVNLMHFALVLLKTGQREEALVVYQRAIHFLPTDRGPLPPLFTSTDFAPADFQAGAYTAMGLYKLQALGGEDAPADFEQAIVTQPNLPTPYFYRGEVLKYKPGRAAEALAAFNQAGRLGGPEMRTFVHKAKEDGTTEFKAAVKKAVQ